MINLDVDGIALAPLNPSAMREPVADAVDAGIPVVIFDSAVDGDAHTSFVATNNRKGGTLGGQHLIKILKEEIRKSYYNQLLVKQINDVDLDPEACFENSLQKINSRMGEFIKEGDLSLRPSNISILVGVLKDKTVYLATRRSGEAGESMKAARREYRKWQTAMGKAHQRHAAL